MKNLLRLRHLFIFLLAAIAIETSAQTSGNTNSVALIDSYIFQNAQLGIKKLLDLQNNLNVEFKPRQEEVESMSKKYNELKKRIEQNTNDNAARQKLVDEAIALESTIRRKSEDYDGQLKKRYQAVMSPLQEQIGTHLKTWCRKKGFIGLIDVAKDNNGLIMWMDGLSVEALTLELIKYLNTVL